MELSAQPQLWRRQYIGFARGRAFVMQAEVERNSNSPFVNFSEDPFQYHELRPKILKGGPLLRKQDIQFIIIIIIIINQHSFENVVQVLRGFGSQRCF